MRHSDLPKGKTLQKYPPARRLRTAAVTLASGLLILMTAACKEAARDSAVAGDYGCGRDGSLAVELHGGLQARLDWSAAELSCAGMPRPAGAGARLRLSGPLDDAPDTERIAIILGIPDLARGATGSELPTNATLIEEGAGRFFGTSGANGCWTDIHRHEPAGEPGSAEYLVSGTVYCVAPLAELNGGSSISFTELEFTGRIDWDEPE